MATASFSQSLCGPITVREIGRGRRWQPIRKLRKQRDHRTDLAAVHSAMEKKKNAIPPIP